MFVAIAATGCGNSSNSSTFSDAGASGASAGDGSGGSSGGLVLGGNGDGGVECAACMTPQTCVEGGTPTTISGTVYDPAAEDPLYNVTVFVPNSALPKFKHGASCDSCDTLYPTDIFASAVTDATGHFVLQNAPAGSNVPVVVQVGKWRRLVTIPTVSPCVDNPQPDKTLRLPRKSSEGDLPDIAISTGGADSLECLPLRLGVDASEYTPGAATPGHIHIFTGYLGASTSPASPASSASLWDSTADLMNNDVLLLSCESRPTASMSAQNQEYMVEYTSGGGRVFASHYQYAWFNTGPFGNDNLATWTTGSGQLNDTLSFPANIVTTLSNGNAFPEGTALQTWLGNVSALDATGQLDVWYARHNADVAVTNVYSQPWLSLDPSTPAPNATEYFTFDTPVGAGGDSGAPTCGRVAYSDLHVSGGPGANEPPGTAPDYPAKADGGVPTVPADCAVRPLTAQEKALEFMLFDLSSCLITIGNTPIPPPPK